MATPKVYIDACCIIEAIKGRRGLPLSHDRHEVEMIERIMKAANDQKIALRTSMITLAEVIHVGEKPPPPDLAPFVERLLLSGRNGITTIAPSPIIVMRARDLAIKDGLWDGAADRIHMATALEDGVDEFLSVDGRLAKRLGKSKIGACSIIRPSETRVLPAEYLQHKLQFEGEND